MGLTLEFMKFEMCERVCMINTTFRVDFMCLQNLLSGNGVTFDMKLQVLFTYLKGDA